SAHPGSTFLDYRLPERLGDAGLVRVALPEGAVREVFVSSGGTVVGEFDPDRRIMAVVKRVHSQLLIGEVGNRLVELAACWAIVMILSGLYLWWPRGQGAAGVVWPRLGLGKRAFWRDLHAVTGFWISSLALVLLVSGLPWAGVWGPAFATVRAELGWVKGAPSWEIDSARAAPADGGEHHHHMVAMGGGGPFDIQAFDRVVSRAAAEKLAFPAIVTPPGAPGRFGAPGVDGWTMRSDAANVPLQTTVGYDSSGQVELSRERFGDSHPIDRAIGYGIAWHTGQLFGWINQLVGVLTALGLVTMAVSGFVMWRRRKPVSAPPKQGTTPKTVVAALVVLGLLLPLFGASLLALLAVDRIVIAVRKVRAPTW
ncbi:MAG TPA: PepSY domain-containing protein, partial [Croceibacterium sp.]|nr:PepSY domain-containing protein [Croceibacterium sp.]